MQPQKNTPQHSAANTPQTEASTAADRLATLEREVQKLPPEAAWLLVEHMPNHPRTHLSHHPTFAAAEEVASHVAQITEGVGGVYEAAIYVMLDGRLSGAVLTLRADDRGTRDDYWPSELAGFETESRPTEPHDTEAA